MQPFPIQSNRIQQNPNMTTTQTLLQTIKSISQSGTISEARKLHAFLLTSNLTSTYLLNHLINLYSELGSTHQAHQVFKAILQPNVFSFNAMVTAWCNEGRLGCAREVFDGMPERDSVCWNVMMTGYAKMGFFEDSMRLFGLMVRDLDCRPDLFSLSCAFKASGGGGNVSFGCQVHCFAFKFGVLKDPHVGISILDFYLKCGLVECATVQFGEMDCRDMVSWNNMIMCHSKMGGVDRAMKMFYEMPEWDILSWNTIISVLSRHGYGGKTLSMLIEMHNAGFKPDCVTYACVISACASIHNLRWGRHLHGRIYRAQSGIDVFVGSGLVDMYAKCGSLETAKRVFDGLVSHSSVAWTSLIAGFIQYGFVKEALVLFIQMRDEEVACDQYTLATVLGACLDVFLGGQLHSHSIKLGIDLYIPVSNALIAMYARCGSIPSSVLVFRSMTMRDVISWTSMVTVHSQAGDLANAISYFNEMPERNLVSWNSMLAAFTQRGHSEDGVNLYRLMHKGGKLKPDWITFATLLSACADIGSLKLGNQIVAQLTKSSFDTDTSVANGIITMYSKCGRINESQQVFNSIANKDLVSWNSLMSGYAQNGLGRKVIEVFECMLQGVTPDHVSYIAVLSGCSHSGLVSEGKGYFNSMTKDHNVFPTIEHYACMVDLLGRAGLLEQAKEMIDKMPIPPSSAVWGALVGACKIHGNTELAEYAAKHLIQLESNNSGGYVLLASIYSDVGKSGDVADLRKLMRDRGVRKNRGCSWIEANDNVHVFTSEDMNHPQIEDILAILDDVLHRNESKEHDGTIESEGLLCCV